MADVGTLLMKVDANTKGFKTKMGGVNKIIGGVTKGILAGAAALTAFGTASLITAAKFEKGMSKIEAITNGTEDEMAQLEETAKNLGATTAFSAREAAEGMAFLGMAGFETNEIIAAMPGLLNLAAAGGSELGRTADIVSDSLSAFKLEAEDTGRLSDVMAKAMSSANVTIETLGESFKFAAPVAGALGFSIEDVTASLAAMGNKGVKGSMAGTALKMAMIKMGEAAGDADSEFAQLGVELTDTEGNMNSLDSIINQLQDAFSGMSEAQKVNTASSLFGQRSMVGMLGIIDDTAGAYDDLKVKLDAADGSAKKMADTMLDNLSGQMTLLKSATEGIAIEIGQSLIPIFSKFAQWILKNMPEIKAFVVATFEAVVKFGGNVWRFFSDNLLPIFKALWETASTLFPIIKNVVSNVFEKIVEVGTTLWTFFKDNIMPIFMSVWETVKDNWPLLQEKVATVFTAIKTAATKVWNYFDENILPIFTTIFEEVRDNWPTIQTTAETVWTGIKDAAKVFWTWVDEFLLPIFTTIFEAIQTNWPLIKTTAETVWGAIKIALEAVWTVIDLTLVPAFESLSDWFTDNNNIGDIFEISLKAIGTTAEWVGEKISFLVGLFTTYSNFMDKIFPKSKDMPLFLTAEKLDEIQAANPNTTTNASIATSAANDFLSANPDILTSGNTSTNNNVNINISGADDPDIIMRKVVDVLRHNNIINR